MVTKTQAETLEAIGVAQGLLGIPPSLKDLKEMLGLKSVQAVADRIKRLEGLGLIERDRRPRSIRLTDEGRNQFSARRSFFLPQNFGGGFDFRESREDFFLGSDGSTLETGIDTISVSRHIEVDT